MDYIQYLDNIYKTKQDNIQIFNKISFSSIGNQNYKNKQLILIETAALKI